MNGTEEMLRTRLHDAIRTAWPDLAEEAVTSVGLDVGQLTQLLQDELGHDVSASETEARSAMIGALLPVRGGNAGWVELLLDDGETVVARGQLHLHDTSPDAPGGPPAGAIEHLRVHDETGSLAAGAYRIRFEESGEIRPVATVTEPNPVLPDMVAVVFLDDGLPSTVAELSAGD